VVEIGSIYCFDMMFLRDLCTDTILTDRTQQSKANYLSRT